MSTAGKNIVWLTLSRILSLVLLFVAYVFLFRYLGPYGTGQHQFVLSFVTIFAVIVDFGIQQYIIKRMSEDKKNTKKYFQNFLVVETFLALFVYTALVFIAYLNNYEPVIIHAIMVAGIGMMINGLTYPFLSVMSANHDLKKVAFINFLNSFINVIVISLTIIFDKYIVFLVTNQLIFGFVGLILYSRFVRKHLPKPEVLRSFVNIDFKLIKTILKAAWPFALLVGFSTIYNRIDTILIYRFLGAFDTGLYGAAYKFFDLVAFFPSVVSFSLYPVFAGLMAKKAFGEVRATIEKYFRVLVALALPMAVGGSILALPIVVLLAGQQFAQAASVVSILIWAPTILILYIVVNSLVISQLTRLAVIVTAVNVAINIVGNIILLPYIGIKGAAIMTVASELIQGVFYFYFVYNKITRFNIIKFLWRPILASFVMGLVLKFTYTPEILQRILNLTFIYNSEQAMLVGFALSLLVGIGIYGGTLWLLRFYRPDDKTFLLSFFKRSL